MERFYGELASWWPLISPVDDYRDEAAMMGDVLEARVGRGATVLELGSGGGHNAAWLKARFELTLTDLAPAMLEVSRALNPSCEHVLGDMRSLRLGRRFDAVLIHDAIDYMLTEADLRAALVTAAAHCRPGGWLLITPDHTRESYEPGTDCGGSDGPNGRGVRYLEWGHPVPTTQTSGAVDYVFLLRSPEGTMKTVHERHAFGLFPEATWLALLDEVGFDAQALPEPGVDDRQPRTLFLGQRR